MLMPTPKVSYNFGYGELHEYSVVASQDIERFAEEVPGIYAWYFRLLDRPGNPIDAMKSFDGLFASKSLEFEVKGNLGEHFQGSAKRIPYMKERTPDYVSAVLSATTVFCPPLYIGISIDIKRRLKTHYETLIDFLQRPSSTPSPSVSQTRVQSDESETDTDIESNVFGERIGSILKRNNVFDPEQLFVKILYVPGATKRDLEKAELFVNRSFVPLCGIR
jgi:hypothetical protein